MTVAGRCRLLCELATGVSCSEDIGEHVGTFRRLVIEDARSGFDDRLRRLFRRRASTMPVVGRDVSSRTMASKIAGLAPDDLPRVDTMIDKQ